MTTTPTLSSLDAVFLRDGSLRVEAVAEYPDGKKYRGRFNATTGHVGLEKWTTGYAGQGGYEWRTWGNPPLARTSAFVTAVLPRLKEAEQIATEQQAKRKADAIAKFHADDEKNHAALMHALLKDIHASGALRLLNDPSLEQRTDTILTILGQKAPGEE